MICLVHFILDTENQPADLENSGDGFTSSFDDEEMLQELRKPNRFDDDEFIF